MADRKWDVLTVKFASKYGWFYDGKPPTSRVSRWSLVGEMIEPSNEDAHFEEILFLKDALVIATALPYPKMALLELDEIIGFHGSTTLSYCLDEPQLDFKIKWGTEATTNQQRKAHAHVLNEFLGLLAILTSLDKKSLLETVPAEAWRAIQGLNRPDYDDLLKDADHDVIAEML